MKQFLYITTLGLLFLSVNSCKKSDFSNSATKIVVGNSQKINTKFSEIVEPIGVLSLQHGDDVTIRSIEKMLFTDDAIYVLDNKTDFKNVYKFDSNTGQFMKKIGEEGEGQNQYTGLNDISITNSGNIRLLSAGNSSMIDYDREGKLIKNYSTAMIGDKMECTPSGTTVLYNEHSASPVSELNYLITYDGMGNLIHKSYPYPREKENHSYSFTGFLSSSNDRVWFSPPFNNTIFEVKSDGNCVARYQFDFKEKNLQDADLQNIYVSQIENAGFLNEYFVKSNHYLQIEYQLDGKVFHGILDENTMKFRCLQDFAPDCVSNILLNASIMPAQGDIFAAVLRPEQVKSIVNSSPFDKECLNSFCSNLGDILEQSNKNNFPVVLKLQFKTDVHLN